MNQCFNTVNITKLKTLIWISMMLTLFSDYKIANLAETICSQEHMISSIEISHYRQNTRILQLQNTTRPATTLRLRTTARLNLA